MKKFEVTLLATVLVALGCSDITGPRSHAGIPGPAIPVAFTPHNVGNGPPDETYIIGSDPLSLMPIHNFPYLTWVTLEASGDEVFTSKPKIAGGSPYYQLGRTLDATGIYDGRIYTNPACALQLYAYGDTNLHYPKTYFTTANGLCGDPQKVDTAEIYLTGFVKRGPALKEDSTDCGTTPCHTYPAGSQSVRLRPVPVVLNTLKYSQATFNPANLVSIRFKASFAPDSITVSGNKTQHPWRTTVWQWIGADSTRDPIVQVRPGCVASYAFNGYTSLQCDYVPKESGRMVSKVFVGGWEQTSSITCQCLIPQGDSALNDSTNDFQTRAAILDMLQRSNADSSDSSGFDSYHPGWAGGGWIHEVASVTWRMPGGGFQTDTLPGDGNQDACSTSLVVPLPPVPGATLAAIEHVHAVAANSPLYCKKTIVVNGHPVPNAERPGDGRPYRVAAPDTAPADLNDRIVTNINHVPQYIITHGGFVVRLGPNPGGPNPETWYRVRGGSETQRKCAWAKKYP